jgi:hypothetical protein
VAFASCRIAPRIVDPALNHSFDDDRAHRNDDDNLARQSAQTLQYAL